MKTRISAVLIFALLMMIVLTGLGWWLERKSFEQQISTLEDEMDKQVTFRRNHNLWLHDIMRKEIQDEELNMGKYTNSGLKDTLQYIESRTSEILAQADTTRLEDFLEWGAELKKIYDSQFRWPHEDTLSFSDLTAESILPVQGRLRVLEWEWDVIDLLNRRLNISCSGFRVDRCVQNMVMYPVSKNGFRVKEGDYFESYIILQMGASKYDKWETNIGRISHSSCEPSRLVIPTEGLIPSGEDETKISFSISGIFRQPTGGTELFRIDSVLTVVRE